MQCVATMTGERRDAGHPGDPLSVEAVQARCDDLRTISEPWLPDACSELAPAPLVDRGARIAAAERLQRELVRLKADTERLKQRHYGHQRTLDANDVEGWTILAEVRDDLAHLEAAPFAGLSFVGPKQSPEALHAAADACQRSRMGLRAVARRIDDLERLLAGRGRSVAGRELADRVDQCAQRQQDCQRQEAERSRTEAERRTRPNPSTARRWPSDDRSGPASLLVRQPVLSNAPPSSDGPAHHLAAV